jgi:hypothetical protein
LPGETPQVVLQQRTVFKHLPVILPHRAIPPYQICVAILSDLLISHVLIEQRLVVRLEDMGLQVVRSDSAPLVAKFLAKRGRTFGDLVDDLIDLCFCLLIVRLKLSDSGQTGLKLSCDTSGSQVC